MSTEFDDGRFPSGKALSEQLHAALAKDHTAWVNAILVVGLFPTDDEPPQDLLVVPRFFMVHLEGHTRVASLQVWGRYVTEDAINAVIDATGRVLVPTLVWVHAQRTSPTAPVTSPAAPAQVRRVPSLTPDDLVDPRVVEALATGAGPTGFTERIN